MSRPTSGSPQVPSTFLRQRSDLVVSPNERAVLDLVRRSAGMGRADLTRATGLTAQSVSRIVEELLVRGYVTMGKALANGRGQPSPPLRLNPDAAFAIGVSIMTDAVSAAVMNFSGDILAQAAVPLAAPDLETVLRQIERLIEALTAKHVPNRKRLFGIGVGVTGYFIGQERQVNPPDPLSELAFVDLDRIISERVGLPVWIDNDGNVAAMGESLSGVGQTFNTFAYIYFSKGLGGSLVIDRKVFRGAFGNAGEFAGVLAPSTHNARPTLELLRATLIDHGVDLRDINELVSRFDIAWPGVDSWIAQAKPSLELLIAAISAVMDPEAIVFGGRMPKPLAKRLCAELQFRDVIRRGTPKPRAQLVASRIEGDATAIGAASAPLKAHFFV